MPSGSKKRKANKKNKKDETNPPNPNSQPLPPLPLHQHQENGHVSATDGHGEEEEGEEVFETPRSQTPDPVDAPHSGNGSSPRVPLDEVPEEEVVVFDEPVKEDSTRFYEAGDENPVVSVGDSVSHEDEEPPASRWESARDEGLVEMVMDESAREDLNVTDNHKVLVREVNTVNVNGEEKEMAQVDDDLNEIETSSDRLVEVRVGITEAADVETVLEKKGSAAESPEVLLGKVDASVSHEKEVKIVPLQEEEEEETSSGDGDLDFEADRSEAMRAEGLDGMAMGKSTTDSTEVDTFNVEEAKEIPRIDDGSKETNSDRLAEEKHTPREIPVTENHEILVDEVDSTSREGKGKELSQVDEGLKDTQLDKLVSLVTEEVSQQSEATAENLNKVLVGIVDTTSPPQESGEHSANAARIESSQRSEVARGPLVVRRATLWNCCGLLDVFTGSQRC